MFWMLRSTRSRDVRCVWSQFTRSLLSPYPASSHTRSPMPRSSGERSSYGRNWRSRVSCPGRCARHRPGSSALLHQRPNAGYRTSLSGPSMTSGTQTVSVLICRWAGLPWAVVHVITVQEGHVPRVLVSVTVFQQASEVLNPSFPACGGFPLSPQSPPTSQISSRSGVRPRGLSPCFSCLDLGVSFSSVEDWKGP